MCDKGMKLVVLFIKCLVRCFDSWNIIHTCSKAGPHIKFTKLNLTLIVWHFFLAEDFQLKVKFIKETRCSYSFRTVRVIKIAMSQLSYQQELVVSLRRRYLHPSSHEDLPYWSKPVCVVLTSTDYCLPRWVTPSTVSWWSSRAWASPSSSAISPPPGWRWLNYLGQ